jgi:hypothetical protein
MFNGTRPASLDAINALQLPKHFSVNVAFAAAAESGHQQMNFC